MFWLILLITSRCGPHGMRDVIMYLLSPVEMLGITFLNHNFFKGFGFCSLCLSFASGRPTPCWQVLCIHNKCHHVVAPKNIPSLLSCFPHRDCICAVGQVIAGLPVLRYAEAVSTAPGQSRRVKSTLFYVPASFKYPTVLAVLTYCFLLFNP